MLVSALNLTGDVKMKYEYLKGSEKDFEGAPEWATLYTSCAGEDYFFAEFHGVGARVFDVEKKSEFKIDYAFDGSGVDVIAERRPITEPEWDGVGIPPAGCECEAMISNPTAMGRAWRKVKVVHVGKPGLKSEALVFDVETAIPSWADEFSPLRTEADKKRDETIESIMKLVNSPSQISATVNRLYDAIAAGKIPGVKLEG